MGQYRQRLQKILKGVYYVFTDGSTLSVDSSFTYGSDTAKYYGYIGVRDPQYKERFEQQTVSLWIRIQ